MVTQQFLSVGDFFHTSNPRAVKLAEMNFISTVDSNILKEFILMSFYTNEAEFYPFLCLNWRPMSAPHTGMLCCWCPDIDGQNSWYWVLRIV